MKNLEDDFKGELCQTVCDCGQLQDTFNLNTKKIYFDNDSMIDT